MFQDAVDCLVDALRADGDVAVGAVHRADPGGEHSEIVVHLRERADSRSRRAPRGPLLDSDCRREAFNPLEDRFRHLAHKLPCVGTQALDIPPLPFGVERVERQ